MIAVPWLIAGYVLLDKAKKQQQQHPHLLVAPEADAKKKKKGEKSREKLRWAALSIETTLFRSCLSTGLPFREFGIRCSALWPADSNNTFSFIAKWVNLLTGLSRNWCLAGISHACRCKDNIFGDAQRPGDCRSIMGSMGALGNLGFC